MSRIFKGMNCARTIQNPDAITRQGEIDPVSRIFCEHSKKFVFKIGHIFNIAQRLYLHKQR